MIERIFSQNIFDTSLPSPSVTDNAVNWRKIAMTLIENYW